MRGGSHRARRSAEGVDSATFTMRWNALPLGVFASCAVCGDAHAQLQERFNAARLTVSRPVDKKTLRVYVPAESADSTALYLLLEFSSPRGVGRDGEVAMMISCKSEPPSSAHNQRACTMVETTIREPYSLFVAVAQPAREGGSGADAAAAGSSGAASASDGRVADERSAGSDAAATAQAAAAASSAASTVALLRARLAAASALLVKAMGEKATLATQHSLLLNHLVAMKAGTPARAATSRAMHRTAARELIAAVKAQSLSALRAALANLATLRLCERALAQRLGSAVDIKSTMKRPANVTPLHLRGGGAAREGVMLHGALSR